MLVLLYASMFTYPETIRTICFCCSSCLLYVCMHPISIGWVNGWLLLLVLLLYLWVFQFSNWSWEIFLWKHNAKKPSISLLEYERTRKSVSFAYFCRHKTTPHFVFSSLPEQYFSLNLYRAKKQERWTYGFGSSGYRLGGAAGGVLQWRNKDNVVLYVSFMWRL